MQKTIHQKLVLRTSFVFVGIATIFLAIRFFQKPKPISLAAGTLLSFGSSSAPVELVLLEDFLCHTCQRFMQEIFPMIQKKYIETGKVRFQIFPIAFLDGSPAFANSAICVYLQNPEQFLLYLERFSPQYSESIHQDELLHFVQGMEEIRLTPVRKCMETGQFFPALTKNYDLVQKIMGENIRTPSLYINGVQIPVDSYKIIALHIEKLLQESRW